jgi:hypothetical protein
MAAAALSCTKACLRSPCLWGQQVFVQQQRASWRILGASGLNSIVRVKPDSRVTVTATLAQSTKMNATCKRRRSSEVVLAFCRRFHRYSVSCCQCCGFACFALLKACESFKEKALFCYRISAARKLKKARLSFDRLSFLCFRSRVAHHDNRLWHTRANAGQGRERNTSGAKARRGRNRLRPD